MKKKQFVSKAKKASINYNMIKKYKLIIDNAENIELKKRKIIVLVVVNKFQCKKLFVITYAKIDILI